MTRSALGRPPFRHAVGLRSRKAGCRVMLPDHTMRVSTPFALHVPLEGATIARPIRAG